MDAILFKIESTGQKLSARHLYEILNKHIFTEEKTEGYSDTVIESKEYLSGIIVNKVPTILNVFDTVTQSIIRKEELIITKINFSLDTQNNLFEIFTSSFREAKRAFNTINNTLKDELKVQQYDITIADTLLNIKQEFNDISFSKLNIKNFKIEEYAQGYFEIKNTDNDYAWSVIEQYKFDIVKTAIIINYDGVPYSLFISENGKIKVSSKNKGKTNAFFDLLKEQIFKIN